MNAADPRGQAWTSALRALVLVRLGQELGTDSPLTRALRDAIDAVLGLAG